MDISFWIVLWIIFLVVQNVFDKKKKSKRPPINSENPHDFEIPTLANDPNFPGEENSILIETPNQSAEVREINLAEIYRQKKSAAQNFSSEISAKDENLNEVEEKKLPLSLNSETAMNAIIFSEILGKPKSLRRR
ncbi:MAG: hypothetical protein IJU55_06545 [Selenomonadaceae bacterium]|nr:hypothetical protein [Selenomonadaceae bacterium]